MSKFGTLYLVPVTLGDDNITSVLPPDVVSIVQKLDVFIVESEKSARHFLSTIKTLKPVRELVLHLLNEHTDDKDVSVLLKPLLAGQDVGLMSDAGCPGIADPGAKLVALAHQKNIKVIPFVGPSSILLSLMASGLNGQQFAFLGYLPVDKQARNLRLKEIEKRSLTHKETQIFIETPYRNQHMLEAILSTCHPNTKLCIACNISLSTEMIATKTIASWKQSPLPDLHKRPTVFLLLA
ncbi:SAM-dependent methyltransferase [Methylotenera versatilis]|uniref:SAM-dependent methyltransferase n=1 Tax=Methylotenera versatilis TaxID=1055487 RepID=UPI0006484167|nr:SAM-dependent methyltransferase [Methylotenera versatilis]